MEDRNGFYPNPFDLEGAVYHTCFHLGLTSPLLGLAENVTENLPHFCNCWLIAVDRNMFLGYLTEHAQIEKTKTGIRRAVCVKNRANMRNARLYGLQAKFGCGVD